MLLNLLAKVDALFWPIRPTPDDLHIRPALAERRAEYRELGLPWRVGGGAASRQAKLREFEAMAAAGRLVIAKTAGRQSIHLKLPDAVDTELRRQACLADYDAAMGLLGWLQVEIDAGRCWQDCGQAWVRETHLAATEYRRPNAGRVLGMYAESLLPLMVRGLVESNADNMRHVWYRLAPKGQKLAAEVIAAGRQPSMPLSPDPAARAVYLTTTLQERNRLARATPQDIQEIGPLPMPAAAECDRRSR